MRARRSALGLLLLLLVADPGLAQEAKRVILEITVTHASDQPGGVDPSVRDLYDQLKHDFRYRSLKVIERRRLSLAVDEIGQMKLPNGSWVRVRPLHVEGDRLLMAVEVQGALQTDLRMHNRKKVVISHPKAYEGGRLVISFDPSF